MAHIKGDSLVSEHLAYRRDIDGLRAIAVLTVILFHFKISGIPGGFVGVDVFFVISGYLITGIIDRSAREGTFSARRFYMRRVRRLAPALLAVVAACLCAGMILLSTFEFLDLSMSSIFAVLSVSNIFFWLNSGYFDLQSELKPLLHTWSLGVEEQFYMVWPLLIFGLTKFRNRMVSLAVVGALGLASLAGAEYVLNIAPQAAFYLTPFRVCEFALGAILVWLPSLQRAPNLLKETFFLCGLGLILFAALTFTSEMRFPGLSSLVPSFGAMLVIAACNPRFSGHIVTNRAMVWVGAVSYSAYLIHWPLLVFVQYAMDGEIVPTVQVMLIIATLVLAGISYYLIEQPFRNPGISFLSSARGVGSVCGAAALVIAAFSISSWATQGMSWRVPAAIRVAAAELPESRVYQYREHRCFLQPEDTLETLMVTNFDECLQPKVGQKNYLILGDSLAAHMFIGLHLAFPDVNFLQATSSACMPIKGMSNKNRPTCEPMLSYVFDEYLPAQKGVDAVILVPRRGWAGNAVALDRTLAYLASIDQEVIILAPVPRFRKSVPDLLEQFGKSEGFEEFLRANRKDKTDDRNLIETLASKYDVPVVWLEDLMCTETECEAFFEGKLIYRDDAHFSTVGSVLLGAKLRERFPKLF